MDKQRKANAEALATLREIDRKLSARICSGSDAEDMVDELTALRPRIASAISKAEGRRPVWDSRSPRWVLGMLATWARQEARRAGSERPFDFGARYRALTATHCPGRLSTRAGLAFMRYKHAHRY